MVTYSTYVCMLKRCRLGDVCVRCRYFKRANHPDPAYYERLCVFEGLLPDEFLEEFFNYEKKRKKRNCKVPASKSGVQV